MERMIPDDPRVMPRRRLNRKTAIADIVDGEASPYIEPNEMVVPSRPFRRSPGGQLFPSHWGGLEGVAPLGLPGTISGKHQCALFK